MVESVANVFLETLRDLLVEEIAFLVGVSDEVEQAKRDLRSMHALLMKADRDNRDSPNLNEYVAQLKDLAFKAENVLETYAVKEAFKKEDEGRGSLKEKFQSYICILSECYSVHEAGKDIRDIISRLADLTKNVVRLELGHESSLLSDQEDEVEHHFVGMEKDIETLVSMVKDERRRRRVVKIYGMGGIGKTTLARKIYNHRDVQSYARAWVCIAQHLQPKAILGNILKQLENQTFISNHLEVSELVKRIHRVSTQRKCLIVIDDIWENDDWEIIKLAFPTNCIVLLTTRLENVANQECDHPYKLGFLTEDEGWELLQKIALPQNFGPVETLEDIGREIVVKCGRIPLSISVIGGILRQKGGNLAEWKKVNMNLRHPEGVEQYNGVKQVLELSYDTLPYYLKPCFLYLACFPKNEEIQTERLYLLWMAEGFISYQDIRPNETLRDVAERYLTELAMRHMVQVQKGETHSPRHKFDSCRLHDLMHDLCSSKDEEEKLLKRIDGYDIPSSICNSISRLSITVRSFMLLGKGGLSFQRIGFEDGPIDSGRSQRLRVHVLDNCDFWGNKLPRKLRKLIHLRYLSLRHSNVKELPKFVCCMPYLQTLDLRLLGNIRLPNVIWKMKRLKHLFLPFSGIEVIGGEKLRLDGLDELETLNKIDSWTTCVADILKLINLRELHVRVYDMDSLSAVIQHMSNKKKSQFPCETHLDAHNCDFSSDVFKNVLMSPSLVTLDVSNCNVDGAGFPCYEEGMGENLVDLTVSRVKIGGDVMEELGKYPMLQTLQLRGWELGRMTETTICRSNSFPRLNSLSLHRLPNLKNWEVEEGAMPKLTRLWIDRCRNLEKIPDGLRFISTLRRLFLFKMSEEFNNRITVRGEDYATVSHIHSLDIYGH